MHSLKALEEIDEQFGNLIAIKKENKEGFIGVPKVFVSSIVQFQPLAEVEIFKNSNSRINLIKIESKKSPISHKNTFDGGSFLLYEESIVDEDTILYHIGLMIKENCLYNSIKLLLKVSGTFLFSPQGVPYHWQEEKLVDSRFIHNRELNFQWMNELKMKLSFSVPFNRIVLKPINEEYIKKSLYFSSFNLKKRYTYEIDRNLRASLLEKTEGSLDHIVSRNVIYGGEIDVNLKKDKKCDYILSFFVKKGEDILTESKDMTFSMYNNFKRKRTKHWTDFISQIPILSSSYKDLESVYYKSWYVLFSNRMKLQDKWLKYPFTSVNKFHYYNQFFWDSAFQAISLLWLNNDELAESELKNFILNQWQNGMIPYELFIFKTNGREWMESDFLTTAATQPPVLSISIMEIFKKFGNKSFLSFFYEPLLKYEKWLWKYRDIAKRGLSYCYHIWETGCDNSPKYDSITRNRLLDPPVEGVDFNVFIYILRKTLIEMADILGINPPSYLAERAGMTKSAMNNIMLDQSNSFYYDVYAGENNKIRVKVFSGIFPLITDIPEPSIRNELTDSYLLSEKEFNSPCPIPSVSISEPCFNSNDFWRGSNWPNITWLIIYGVKKYNSEAASIILNKYLNTSVKSNMCYEYYDSITGEGAGLPFQGWGTLYIDLIIRHVLGIEPRADGFSFYPLRTRYCDVRINNLLIHNLNLSVNRKGNKWKFLLDHKKQLTLEEVSPFKLRIEDERFVIIFDNIIDPKKVIVENADFKKENENTLIIYKK